MQRRQERYQAARSLEAYLGDPMDPTNALSFKRSVELDEREEYPAEACNTLYDWDLHHYYVPVEHGGKLGSYEEVLALLRVVSRRDLSVAISDAHTFLGAVPVWIGGSGEQRSRLARRIKEATPACLALTERAHGSDLLSCETLATRAAAGYRVTGEKWPINKATLSQLLTVLARTDSHGGPRGFTLFLLEKDRVSPSSYSHLPRIKTLGIRGCDISGIRLHDCPLPEDARVGAVGSGFELALKGFQITRTLSSSLALGAADTAMRTTLAFALSRKLYGDTIFAIPQARRVLVEAFLDLLVCECVSVTAARALHVSTGQMSILSAVVKYFVPTTIETVIWRLSTVLGARHYFREGHAWGIFQKMMRDNAIVSLFDGSTAVNLHILALQLSHLSRGWKGAGGPSRQDAPSRAGNLFSLDEPLPPFDPEALSPFSWHGDDVVQGLPAAVSELHSTEAGDVEAELLETIRSEADDLVEEADAQADLQARAPKGSDQKLPPALFDLAARYCLLHAAAVCIQIWIHNRMELPGFFASGEWLALSLGRLLRSLGRETDARLLDAWFERVAEEIVRLHLDHKLFSIEPSELAGTTQE